MKTLLKKMFRDLWQLKAQFCSVFLMAFLGLLIYSGIEGVWLGMSNHGTEFFSQTNLADAWVNGTSFSTNDVNNVKNILNVQDVERSFTANVKMKSSESNEKDADLQIICTDGNFISTPYIVSGNKYTNESGNCWLDENFANAKSIKVGDTITLSYGNNAMVCTVKGLIINPEYIYYTGSVTSYLPDHNQYGYCMVSEDTVNKLFGGIQYNQLKVTLKSNANTEQFQKNVEDKLGDSYSSFTDRSNYKGVSSYTDKVKQIQKMSVMFSVVFLLLALLTMQTTMKRLVKNQRTQIGTLKALGFSTGQILFHYSLYGFIVSLAGSIIGFLIAPHLITPLLLNLQKEFYTMPSWSGATSWISYAVIAIVVLCCTLTTIRTSRKEIKGMPAESMREEAPKGGKQIALEHFHSLWNNISFEWKWSFRDISRNKTRTLIGTIGVLGCMMLLIASFGMHDSLNHANQYLYGTQYDYTYKAVFMPTATQTDKTNLLNYVSKDGQWVEENNAEIRTDRDETTSTITIIDSGYYVHLKNDSGNNVVLPDDSVLISQKLAQDMNVNVGDYIKFRIPGDNNYCIASVSGILPIPSPQGIFLSKTEWTNLGQKFNATSLLIGNDKTKDDLSDFSYVKEVTSLQEQLSEANQILNSVTMIIIMLLAAAILLSVIILYNLGVLSYTERSREYATLKVLGFEQKEIRSFVFRDNIVTVIVGWLLGVPVGFLFLKFYVGAVTTDTFEYTPFLTVFYFIIATAITVGCSFAVNLIISKKVRKLDMVSALKSVE